MFTLPGEYARNVTYIPVSQARDPRLAEYVALRDTSLRKTLEEAEGLFIAEGEKVIRRALAAGYQPRSFMLAERWLPGLASELAQFPDVPIFVVGEAIAEEVTGFHVHRGALASMRRIARYTQSDLLRQSRLVVMEDIVDHTNVGAVLRNAAGLGWDGVLLSPRAADPLYRRAIKVSMGAVFSLPWARLEVWDGAIPLLREAGFTVVALALREDAIDLRQCSVQLAQTRKIAILLGTEGAGLSDRWLSQADLTVRIPMSAGIDSLNVAAASAIACYVLGATPDQIHQAVSNGPTEWESADSG